MGWNYRMPELCCAVALAQVENIDFLVERRKKVAAMFEEAASPASSWLTPQYVPDNCVNSYWTWVCKLDLENVSWENLEILSRVLVAMDFMVLGS